MYGSFIGRIIADTLADTPVILIAGERQAGKSTLCRQLLDAKFFSGKSITLDEPTTLAAFQTDPLIFCNAKIITWL